MLDDILWWGAAGFCGWLGYTAVNNNRYRLVSDVFFEPDRPGGKPVAHAYMMDTNTGRLRKVRIDKELGL